MWNFLTLQTPLYLTLALLLLVVFLSLWLTRLSIHYNRLLKTAKTPSLIKAFEGLQKTLAIHEKKLAAHHKHLVSLETKMRTPLQTVLLRRFNPFSHTGGNQSFMLALLDADKNGILLTSLHSRENTRFYVKLIKGGVGENYPLSDEEQKLINSHPKKR